MRDSGRGVGWERIGELVGDLTGDLTGDSLSGFTGEGTDEVVFEAGAVEAGSLTGEAATAAEGDGTEEENGTGAGDGLDGLLTAGDTVAFSGSGSSVGNGSVKKRVSGGFTEVACKKTEKFRIYSKHINLISVELYHLCFRL